MGTRNLGLSVKPAVTIAIPTLGRLEFLRRALASAIAQSYSPIEILIGDNNALTDNAISEMAARDPRVRILRQSSRLTMPAHWNALAAAASGEFFTLLADDDLLDPEFVSKLVDLREKSPEADVFFSDHWIIRPDDTIDREATERYSADNGRAALRPDLLEDSAVAVWNTAVPICSTLMKTELVRKYRFREGLNTPELELFARLVADGVRFAYTPERLAKYRVHSSQETQAVGLKYDLLAQALAEISTPPGAEASRRKLLGNLLVTATTAAYLEGDLEKARRLSENEFYPASAAGRPVILLQRLCTALPHGVAARAYAFLYRALRTLKPQ